MSQSKEEEERQARRRGRECGCPWPAAGRTPRYLDELFKLLNVGLQLGLLDAQFLPAQVQSFHSPLKCLGVEEGGRSGGPPPWEPRKAPASSARAPLSPGLPTFHPYAWFRAEPPRTLAPPSLGLFLCLQREHTIQDSKAIYEMKGCPCGPCTPPPVSHLLLVQHSMVHDLGLLLLLQ